MLLLVRIMIKYIRLHAENPDQTTYKTPNSLVKPCFVCVGWIAGREKLCVVSVTLF